MAALPLESTGRVKAKKCANDILGDPSFTPTLDGKSSSKTMYFLT